MGPSLGRSCVIFRPLSAERNWKVLGPLSQLLKWLEMHPRTPSVNDKTYRNCPYCFTELISEPYCCPHKVHGLRLQRENKIVMHLKFTIYHSSGKKGILVYFSIMEFNLTLSPIFNDRGNSILSFSRWWYHWSFKVSLLEQMFSQIKDLNSAHLKLKFNEYCILKGSPILFPSGYIWVQGKNSKGGSGCAPDASVLVVAKDFAAE